MSLSRNEFLDRKEAAEYLGLSIAWFNKHAMKKDGVPFVRVGRKAYYRKIDLDRFKNANGDPTTKLQLIRAQSEAIDKNGPSEDEIAVAFKKRDEEPEQLEERLRCLLTVMFELRPQFIKSLVGLENLRVGLYSTPWGLFLKNM